MEVRMKNLVRGGILLTAMLGFISTAGAQGSPPPGAQGGPHAGPQGGPHGSPEDRVQTQLGALRSRIGLTDDQASKVQEILSESAREAQADRAAGGAPDPAKARERMRRNDEKIEALLTEDQKTKFAQFKEQRRQRMHGGGQRREGAQGQPPAAPPEPPED